MAGVNESIVRNYFEALGFLVRQPTKHIVQARAKRPEEEIDFVVFNPRAETKELPQSVLWSTDDVQGIARAVVSVRGWHTDRFSAATLRDAPEIFRFLEPAAILRAEEMLGTGPVARILCLPALPVGREERDRALALFRERGVDGALTFRTLLVELIARTDIHSNYDRSDFLQALRILKNYDLIKDAQLELFTKGTRHTHSRKRFAGPRAAPRNTPQRPPGSEPRPPKAEAP